MSKSSVFQTIGTDPVQISSSVALLEDYVTDSAANAAAAAASASTAASNANAAASSAASVVTSVNSAAASASAASNNATNAAASATNAAASESAVITNANNAATSEANAATSETNAATSATNASTSATNAATSATSASSDATATAADRLATAADRVATGNDATATAADAVSTAADAVSTAADATAASTSATNAATSATNAATSETNAAASNTLAQEWASKINGIVDSTEYSSKAWAVGGTGVTTTAGAGPAKDWATKATTVDGTEHSAKSYAAGTLSALNGSAKQWALGGGGSFDRDTAVTGTGITSEYSARYWANQAANSAQDFVDVYYGAFTNDTAAEDYQINDNGGSVNVGDLYFDSTNNVMRVRSFSGWNNVATDTSSFATKGFVTALAIAL
jgi:hypothetical protein